MDIQIASNFERYLYYLHDGDSAALRADMEQFAQSGCLDLSRFRARTAEDFRSHSVSEDETIATIAEFYQKHAYLLDPHTAVGVRAAMACREERPVICLATAHPAKFGTSVQKAIGREAPMPPQLAELAHRESRCEVLDADVEAVRNFVVAHALQKPGS